MNATEIRGHRTVTQALEARLDVVEPVVERLIDQDVSLRNAGITLTTRVTTMEADVHQLQTQHRICNAEDRLIAWELFYGRTFWERLRWLVRGG